MPAVANRRSVMTLFSGPTDIYSHQVRLVAAEKGIDVDIVKMEPSGNLEELAGYNPYVTVPTLVDRELSLYEARIITEYLDERFPHPPLMPADPVMRARNRLMLFRVEKELYGKIEALQTGSKTGSKPRKELTEDLVAISPLFEKTPFFMSDGITLVDCALAPLLWRLPQLKIELPRQAKPLMDYGERLFKRASFRQSLSDAEEAFRN